MRPKIHDFSNLQSFFGLFKNRKPILGFLDSRSFRDFQNFKIFEVDNLMRPKIHDFSNFFNNFFGLFKNRKQNFGFRILNFFEILKL